MPQGSFSEVSVGAFGFFFFVLSRNPFFQSPAVLCVLRIRYAKERVVFGAASVVSHRHLSQSLRPRQWLTVEFRSRGIRRRGL